MSTILAIDETVGDILCGSGLNEEAVVAEFVDKRFDE